MPINDGLLVEDEILASLNNKKISELGNNMRFFLRSLFGPLDENEMVFCHKTDDSFKVDLVIEYKHQIKNISVKTGRAEIVHNEILDNFTDFLLKEGVSNETIETIRLFHYGDGTTDGTGNARMSYIEIAHSLKDRIKKANEELNYRKELVLKTIYHCVFKGANENNPEIDAIYFGTKDYGVMATKKQILTHIRKRNFSFFENLHIGPLLIRPDARYVGKEIASERKRNRMVAYWPNLNADIEYISKRYDY